MKRENVSNSHDKTARGTYIYMQASAYGAHANIKAYCAHSYAVPSPSNVKGLFRVWFGLNFTQLICRTSAAPLPPHLRGRWHHTGIGPTSSALCVIDVMQKCGSRVRDVFFSGTSGWSPQLGGVLNNGSCSSPNTNGQITRCDRALPSCPHVTRCTSFLA